MAIKHFDTQEELDDEFERIEELNMELVYLRDEVEEAKRNLEYAEKALQDFEEDNREYLF